MQEWVDIATSKLSQPNWNSEELILSPRSDNGQRRIALGSFEYTVDKDESKAFLEEKAKKGKKLITR